jgi:hypothetical protein
MPETDRVGARVVARISAGVPTDRDVIDRLDDRWRALADDLVTAQPEARKGVRKRHLDAWDDGRAMLAAILQANPSDDPFAEPVSEAVRQRFALKTAADLQSMQPPTYQIDGHIPKGGLVVIFGPSGSGKTFEAIEQACCIASGTAWHGLERVAAGPIVYVAAEGASGLGKRLRAWERAHPGADLSRLHFITEPVNLMDPLEIEAFLSVLRALPEPPAAVLFDTLARCMVGADENSSRDMGIAIAAMDSIRREFGATVVPIHHTGKNGEDERGSSALRGAADTMIKVASDGTTTRLTCIKQKDDEEFKPVTLRLQHVEDTESCILEYDDDRFTGELRPKARELLEILETHFSDDDAPSSSAWLKASRQADPTFWRSRRDLIRGGYVAKDGRSHALTALGRQTLGLPEKSSDNDTVTTLSPDCHDSNPKAAATTITTITTLRGDSDSSADSRAGVLSGRPRNGVYEVVNAATDDIGELP